MNTKVNKTAISRSKKIPAKNYENENEKMMDEISNEMANYFDKRITASYFSRWISESNSSLSAYSDLASSEEDRQGAISFVNDFGYWLLPELIKCQNKENRIKALKEQIPFVFGLEFYKDSKAALAEIGIVKVKAFAKLTHGQEEISEYMSIYATLLGLAEMYGDYEFHEKKLRESENKVA